jgi:integrase/recombinase XerD
MRKDNSPVRSYAKSNQQLLGAFETYLISLNRSAPTRRSYLNSAGRLVEVLGSKDAADLDRGDIRRLQSQLLAKGVTANSIRLHIGGIRAFSKFLRLAGLTSHDPTLLLAQRKLPVRVPRVLTVAEVERLIAASETPLERAIIEVLYATGVRISELTALRVENITFSEPGVIRVERGKGDKDRNVYFGKPATAAIGEYLNGRTTGFLFEAPAMTGEFIKPQLLEGAGHRRPNLHTWRGRYYANGVQHSVRLGKVRDMSEAEARQKLDQILAETPGFTAHPTGPYDARSIRLLLKHLAFRARVAGVHPHAFRRAFAIHMLEGGADLRVIQELLGHVNVTTTARYLNLSAANLKKVHERCHPHAQEDANAEEK